MRELIIIRHAIAPERDSTRWPDDRDRPLSREGRRRFRRVASRAARWVGKVDLLLTSPLARAKQTADILRDEARWPKPVEKAELDPSIDPERTLASLVRSKGQRIALIGHEPHLSAFIGVCIAHPDSAVRLQMKKGAIAVIGFTGALRPGRGMLLALIPPKTLRRMK